MVKNIPLLLLIFLPLIIWRCTADNAKKNVDISPAQKNEKTIALEKVMVKDEDGNLVSFSKRVSSGVKEGTFVKMSPDSVLIEIANYHNDTLDGRRILFSMKGDTETVETYKSGAFEGSYISYYENGQIAFKGVYQQNSMEGVWRRFYKSGELMEEVAFSNNQENGPFVEYNENGTLKAEGTYKNGDNEDGELKMYDENGELIRKMQCDNGMCKTIWKKE